MRKQTETSIFTKSVILKKARQNNLKVRHTRRAIFFYKGEKKNHIENKAFTDIKVLDKFDKILKDLTN